MAKSLKLTPTLPKPGKDATPKQWEEWRKKNDAIIRDNNAKVVAANSK